MSFDMERRHIIRSLIAGLVCVAAGLAGFSGLEAFYVVCGLGGLLAGRPAAAIVLPAVAISPALVGEIGIGFHADRTSDYLLAAPVILGGGALAALLGASLSSGLLPGIALLRSPLSRFN
jgi:hypothetical protein